MLFSDSWKECEESISDKIIIDILKIINFNKKQSIRNNLCIKYISICDSDKTYRYIIFVPFVEYSDLYYENNYPYIFMKVVKIHVSDDFMKWLFYTTRATKTPVIIGKLDTELSGAWNICNGDSNITWKTEAEQELTTFERWLYERPKINSDFKIYLKNPMLSKVPFPITEQNFVIAFNNEL